eukprot:364996-Chlamydomonas_euryale.AAC.8
MRVQIVAWPCSKVACSAAAAAGAGAAAAAAAAATAAAACLQRRPQGQGPRAWPARPRAGPSLRANGANRSSLLRARGTTRPEPRPGPLLTPPSPPSLWCGDTSCCCWAADDRRAEEGTADDRRAEEGSDQWTALALLRRGACDQCTVAPPRSPALPPRSIAEEPLAAAPRAAAGSAPAASAAAAAVAANVAAPAHGCDICSLMPRSGAWRRSEGRPPPATRLPGSSSRPSLPTVPPPPPPPPLRSPSAPPLRCVFFCGAGAVPAPSRLCENSAHSDALSRSTATSSSDS